MAYNYYKEGDSKTMIFIRDHFSEIVMVVALIAFFLTGLFTFLSYATENTQLVVDQVREFNDNWNISETDNGNGTHTITFKNTLPKNIGDNSAFAFKGTDETIFVYVDGKQIYSYGVVNNFKKPINLGSQYVLADIPDGSEGKEIVVTATYYGKHTQWRQNRDFFIEGNDGIILELIKDDLVAIIICFIMSCLAVFEFFKSIYLMIKHQSARVTLYLALFILASSNWLASDTVLMQLAFGNTFVKYIVTYFSFLTLPCLFPMFAKERMTKHSFIMACLAVLSWAYAIVSMLLYVIFSIGFDKHLYVSHGLMAFVVTVVFICCILERKNKQLRSLLTGTLILAFFAIISLISYHRGYIDSVLSAYFYRSYYFAGMISFIAILLYDTYQQTAQDKAAAALSEFYKKSAYTDLLTKLGSRTAFTEDFETTENEIENYENVTVIMLDLNNLKQTNDIKGHDVGDRLIKELAQCLKTTFGDLGKIYRIGGDEFIILLKNLDDTDIEKYLDTLRDNINNQENSELTFNNVAIGYAQRTGAKNTDKGVYGLFKIADEKMYEDKSLKKAKSSGKTPVK